MADLEPILVSVTQGARLLGCGRSVLYVHMASGAIRSVKLGRKRLVDVASLKHFAASVFKVPLNKMLPRLGFS